MSCLLLCVAGVSGAPSNDNGLDISCALDTTRMCKDFTIHLQCQASCRYETDDEDQNFFEVIEVTLVSRVRVGGFL